VRAAGHDDLAKTQRYIIQEQTFEPAADRISAEIPQFMQAQQK
jgi:hypothetical protein